jgi:hypothetical protein
MSRDRSMSETGTQSSAANPAGSGRPADFIQPAPLGDILFEQLEYLVAHATQACAPGCSDCARLQQVKSWLLLPFGGARRPRVTRRAA